MSLNYFDVYSPVFDCNSNGAEFFQKYSKFKYSLDIPNNQDDPIQAQIHKEIVTFFKFHFNRIAQHIISRANALNIIVDSRTKGYINKLDGLLSVSSFSEMVFIFLILFKFLDKIESSYNKLSWNPNDKILDTYNFGPDMIFDCSGFSDRYHDCVPWFFTDRNLPISRRYIGVNVWLYCYLNNIIPVNFMKAIETINFSNIDSKALLKSDAELSLGSCDRYGSFMARIKEAYGLVCESKNFNDAKKRIVIYYMYYCLRYLDGKGLNTSISTDQDGIYSDFYPEYREMVKVILSTGFVKFEDFENMYFDVDGIRRSYMVPRVDPDWDGEYDTVKLKQGYNDSYMFFINAVFWIARRLLLICSGGLLERRIEKEYYSSRIYGCITLGPRDKLMEIVDRK